jgi:hypothetical protein
MKQILYELPITSSARTRGPTFAALLKRECELAYYVETQNGDRKIGIIFEGVEAYKCTYMTARSVEMINVSYDKLVRIDVSPWLAAVQSNSSEYYKRRQGSPPQLQHLMICFDDGPCYEIICVDFRISEPVPEI